MRSLLLSLAVAAALVGCRGGTGFEACFDGFDNDGDGAVDCDDFECMADIGCVGGDTDTTDTKDTSDTNEPPPFETNCTDGIDEDEDGQTDCRDTDCATTAACPQPEDCNDGKDNDKDGSVDCKDTDCTSDASCDREICSDGIDNDGDQAVDCLDPDCSGLPLCQVPSEICTDKKDNDQDGFVDCADSDCATIPVCKATEICSDAKDNDGDLAVDCADSDCALLPLCKVEICDDSKDNDADKLADCADPDCVNDATCLAPGENCNDPAGVDEDNDGLINCRDPDCVGGPACDEMVGFVEIGHTTVNAQYTSLTGTATDGWESYPLDAATLRTPTRAYCAFHSTITGTPHSAAASCVGCQFTFLVTFSATTGPSGTNCNTWSTGTFDPSGQSYGYGYDPTYGTGQPTLMAYSSTYGWYGASYDVSRSATQFEYAWLLSDYLYYY